MLSPIQIKHHWVRRLDITSSVEPIEESKYTFQFLLHHQPIDKMWHVVLGVKFMAEESSESNYSGTIEMEGAFEIHPDFDSEKVEELVKMNGGALLYGAVREMIMMITSRCKNGPLDLPSVDARMFLTMKSITASDSFVTKDS